MGKHKHDLTLAEALMDENEGKPVSDKKKTKPKRPAVSRAPLQVVWKNPDDGAEYGLDVCICPEFGCLILGPIDDPRVQHHMRNAHKAPSGILSEVGIQRMGRIDPAQVVISNASMQRMTR